MYEMNNGYHKFAISYDERQRHHLVITSKMHDIVKYFAKKWNTSISNASQLILEKGVEHFIKKK